MFVFMIFSYINTLLINSSVLDHIIYLKDMTERQEQIEPKIVTATTEKKVQTQPQQEKIEKKEPGVQINPMLNPSKVKQENQKVFHAAHGERKAMNIQRIKDYMQKRVQSYKERVRICDTIRSMLFEKQKNTKAFLKNIIRFFQDYAELYASLHKSISKLELKKKYQNHTMYTAIKESVGQLVKLNDQQADHVQKFVDWLEKILVEAFKSSDSYFKERMKKINKDLETSDYNYFNSWSKQQKAYEKLSEGNDLLQKELILMENIKNTNQTAITRSVDLLQAWQFLLEEQNTIKKLLKDNILQFYDRFVKFHKKTDTAASIFKYWSNLPSSANAYTVFSSFLDDKSIQYINFGSKSKRLQDNFQNFMRMVYQQDRIGNPYPYLEILIAKKFTSKLQLSQRDWKAIKLIFTVDHNLLIFDEKEGKIILKLMQNSIKLKRVSENILQLSGVEEGVIFNSKKKQSIHFETLDQVEQFIYFVNSIPEKKEQQK